MANPQFTGLRSTSKVALKDLIEQKKIEIAEYEALLAMLPDEMNQESDMALWRLVISIRR